MASHDNEQLRAVFAGEVTATHEWFDVAMMITLNDGKLTYAIRKPGETGVRVFVSTDDPEIIAFVKGLLAEVHQVSFSAD